MQTGTDYGPYLANEAPPLHTTAIVDCCTRRLAETWETMRCNAAAPLSTFLDYCTYGHMIDNVVLIVTGLLHERDVQACDLTLILTFASMLPSVPASCLVHALPRLAQARAPLIL
jgi:vacuolar-type H+-ATPase subunit C/Vma6